MGKTVLTLLLLLLITNSLISQNTSLSKYLEPTKYINSDNIEIISKVKELTVNSANDKDRLEAIYNFVRDSYTDTSFESKIASDILQLGGNSCHQRSILFTALCRTVNIPSRLHWQKVTIKDFKLNDGKVEDITFIHGIVGVYQQEKWFLYEPVGNDMKWKNWVQKEENNTLDFVYGQDCLFSSTEKITFETLPINFSDYFEDMMILRRNISSGLIEFN